MLHDGDWVCMLSTPAPGAIPVYITPNRTLGKQIYVIEMPIPGTVLYVYPTTDQRATWVYIANQTGPLQTVTEVPTHRIP
jgi:hypothetical protein